MLLNGVTYKEWLLFLTSTAPTIVTGAITLGFVQQIIRAFGRVETSLNI